MEALKKSDKAVLTHINLNDNSVEGLEIVGKKAFSVQYHPEAAPDSMIQDICLMIL